jgi:hypothetical protein
MSKAARILIVVAGALLGGMFIFPLWSVRLLAPQYPEGLGMLIGVHTISGLTPNDIDNINELNHYIGMKTIDPGAIPELHVMPWIVIALVALALLAALWNKRALLFTWLLGVAAFGVMGLVSFWRWSYDYGHNLDIEHAIIKIPGAVYQPPLLGTKQILNFTATSWPSLGAWLALLAFAVGLVAFLLPKQEPPASLNNILQRLERAHAVGDAAMVEF